MNEKSWSSEFKINPGNCVGYPPGSPEGSAETPKQLRKRAAAVEKQQRRNRKAQKAAAKREQQRKADIALSVDTLRDAAKNAPEAEDRVYAAELLYKIQTGTL